MDKITCYKCDGTGQMKLYIRDTCSVCEKRDKKIFSFFSLEKCPDCVYSLRSVTYNCPICHGEGIIDWIDNMFKKDDIWKRKE